MAGNREMSDRPIAAVRISAEVETGGIGSAAPRCVARLVFDSGESRDLCHGESLAGAIHQAAQAAASYAGDHLLPVTLHVRDLRDKPRPDRWAVAYTIAAGWTWDRAERLASHLIEQARAR